MFEAVDIREITQAALDAGAIQKGSEFAALLELACMDPPRTIVEIGSATGGTLLAWRRAFPEARVLSIDLPGGPYSAGDPIVLPSGVELIVGDSHQQTTLDELVRRLDGDPVDLLFIDGDHTFMGVRSDFAMYGPLVRSMGVIAFHDICQHPMMPDVEVSKFWRQLKWPGWRYEVVTEPDTWGGIGVLKVPDTFPTESVPKEVGPPIAVLIPSSGTNNSFFMHRMRFLIVPPGGLREALPVGPYISQNLRDATRELLKDPSWRRLLIVETDMVLPFDALLRHNEHTEPIVGSAYFMHGPPFDCYAWHTNGEDDGTRILPLDDAELEAMLDAPGTYPVDAVGFGCTSIAREVLEGWPKDRPLFHNSWAASTGSTPGFAGEVGHDILFCAEARAMGHQVYLDTAVQCGHIGSMVVDVSTWRSHRQLLRTQGAPNGEVSGYPSGDLPDLTPVEA